jgi:hypothetical protein
VFEPCAAHEDGVDPVQRGRIVQRIAQDGQDVRVVADGESALAPLESTGQRGLRCPRT